MLQTIGARFGDDDADLLGPDFDPQRHQCGVDVAFALETRAPRQVLPEPIATWLAEESDRRAAPVIGFNVSGLIWHDPVAMRQRYGFKADYQECVLSFLRRILRETDTRLILVPHVLTPPGDHESDPAANTQVATALSDVPGAAGRVAVVPPVYDPMETKWIIARTDWFCGTRMHACIAGLSSGVPTAAIAYSVKTQGVFETCGQGAHVADPRLHTTAEVVAQLWMAWHNGATIRAALDGPARDISQRAKRQIAAIVAHVRPDRGVALGREVPA